MQGGGQRGAHYDYIRRFVAMAQCAVRLQQVGKPSGREQFEKYIEFSRQARALSMKIAAGKDGEGGLELFDGPAGQVSVDIPAAETFMAAADAKNTRGPDLGPIVGSIGAGCHQAMVTQPVTMSP